MNTTLYFFSLESLQQFASENVIKNSHLIKLPTSYIRVSLDVLSVVGFSEVVPCYEVRLSDDNSGAYWIDSSYFVLHIITSNEFLRFHEVSRGKFRFYLFERPSYLWRDTNFRFDMPEPNLIGKATEKKLQSWIDFLHMERTALINYVNGNMYRNKNFTERVRAKFPEAIFDTAPDGWTSLIRFEWLNFYVTLTAHENGSFSRDLYIRYSAVPDISAMLS